MAYNGTFRTVDFSDLLNMLAKSKKFGCLTVSNGVQKKYIYFRSGEILYATSVRDEDRFGAFLIRFELLNNEQLAQGLELHEKTGKMLGESLVQLGFLDTAQLAEHLQRLVKGIVFDIFTWKEGDFEFLDDRKPPMDADFKPLSVAELIEEGKQKAGQWTQIQKTISAATILQLSRSNSDSAVSISLSAAEFQLLALCDGIKDVAEICEESPLSDFDTHNLLAKMLQAGFLEVQGRPAKMTDEQADYEKLVKLIAFYQVPQRLLVEHLEIAGGSKIRLQLDELYRLQSKNFAEFFHDTELKEDGTFNKPALVKNAQVIPKSRRLIVARGALDHLIAAEVELLRSKLSIWSRMTVMKKLRADVKKAYTLHTEIVKELEIPTSLDQII